MSSPMLEEVDPLLHKAIEIEKAKIKIDPYYETVMAKSFRARAHGLFSGMVLGALTGLAVGAAALYVFPSLIGIKVAASLGMLAEFGVAGMGIGGLGGQIIGSTTGSAAAAAEERERREKGQGLEAQILASPELQQVLREKYANDDLAKNTPTNTIRDVLDKSRNDGDVLRQLFNVRTAVLVGLIGAAFGALIGMTGTLPFVTVTGAGVQDMMLYGAGMFSVAGMSIGFNYPVIFTSLSKFADNLLSGKLFERGKETEYSPELEQRLQQELTLPPISKLQGTRLDELRARGYTPTEAAVAVHADYTATPTPSTQIQEALHQEQLQAETGRPSPTLH